ncbi:MAG: ATP-binding protein [Acidimicrobiales bacterium]
MVTAEFRTALPGLAASAREARTFVRSSLAEMGLDALADTAVLLVSELVANVVLHASGDMEVMVSPTASGVIVRVHDGLGELRPTRKRYSETATTGRGLMLVDALAHRWGIDRDGAGKLVWFELERPTDG